MQEQSVVSGHTLGTRVVNELGQLNQAFLSLVLQGSRDPLLPVHKLQTLSAPALHRITHCAISLFTFELGDVAGWQSGQDATVPHRYSVSELSVRPCATPQMFTLSALMYLRHLASDDPFLASLGFSVGPKMIEALVSTPLPALQKVAATDPDVLRSRIPPEAATWSELACLARRKDGRALVAARLLGDDRSWLMAGHDRATGPA